MNISCKIVQDLLPLYHDGVCSQESRKLVEEHLNECETCKRMLEEMESEWVSPEVSQNELKPLVSISETVKRGKRRALFKGVAIAMAVVVLLFGAVNVWWYVGYYRFYLPFAEGHDPKMMYAHDLEGNLNPEKSRVLDANEFVWEDETYRYRVQVPDYLQRNGRIDMGRLDNGESKSISLHISKGVTGGKYTYHVSIRDGSGENTAWETFMLDQDMIQEYLSHWDEEIITEQNEAFVEYEAEIMEIIEDAQEMWEFLK